MDRIIVIYTSIDRARIKRIYKSLAGARRFAHRYVGAHPEMGSIYAVSSDGIGKIEVWGATLKDLFPEEHKPPTCKHCGGSMSITLWTCNACGKPAEDDYGSDKYRPGDEVGGY